MIIQVWSTWKGVGSGCGGRIDQLDHKSYEVDIDKIKGTWWSDPGQRVC